MGTQPQKIDEINLILQDIFNIRSNDAIEDHFDPDSLKNNRPYQRVCNRLTELILFQKNEWYKFLNGKFGVSSELGHEIIYECIRLLITRKAEKPLRFETIKLFEDFFKYEKLQNIAKDKFRLVSKNNLFDSLDGPQKRPINSQSENNDDIETNYSNENDSFAQTNDSDIHAQIDKNNVLNSGIDYLGVYAIKLIDNTIDGLKGKKGKLSLQKRLFWRYGFNDISALKEKLKQYTYNDLYTGEITTEEYKYRAWNTKQRIK